MSLTHEQLIARRQLITATDASAIVGVNPWRSRVDVYLEKIDESPPNPRRSYKMDRGHALEQLGLSEISARKGVLVKPNSETIKHPILTWLGATPDGMVIGNKDRTGEIVGGAEAKSVGVRVARDWTDDDGEQTIPLYVHVQVAVQIAVLNVPVAYVAAMLDNEDEPRIYTVERDRELESSILDECEQFHRDHVLARVPPTPASSEEGSRLARALYPKVTADLIEATPELEEQLSAYAAVREVERKAKREREAIEAELLQQIGPHEGIRGRAYRLTWKEREGYTVPAYEVKPGRRIDFRQVKEGAFR